MILVVDASVAIKWLIQEQGSDAARRLLTEAEVGLHELQAPALILLEAQYALSKRYLNGTIPHSQLSRAVETLVGLVALHPVERHLASIAARISLDGIPGAVAPGMQPRPFNVHDCVYTRSCSTCFGRRSTTNET